MENDLFADYILSSDISVIVDSEFGKFVLKRIYYTFGEKVQDKLLKRIEEVGKRKLITAGQFEAFKIFLIQ